MYKKRVWPVRAVKYIFYMGCSLECETYHRWTDPFGRFRAATGGTSDSRKMYIFELKIDVLKLYGAYTARKHRKTYYGIFARQGLCLRNVFNRLEWINIIFAWAAASSARHTIAERSHLDGQRRPREAHLAVPKCWYFDWKSMFWDSMEPTHFANTVKCILTVLHGRVYVQETCLIN